MEIGIEKDIVDLCEVSGGLQPFADQGFFHLAKMSASSFFRRGVGGDLDQLERDEGFVFEASCLPDKALLPFSDGLLKAVELPVRAAL